MNRQTVSLGALASVLLAAGVPVMAAPAYVTDQLRLGVHAAPDTSDRQFTSISSGDRVEMLEENQYYARVKIPDGREGWVKKNYLLADRPAILMLAESEKARDDALAELDTLKSSLADRESRVSAIEQQVVEREAQARAEQEELLELRAERLDLMARLDAYSFNVPGSLFVVGTVASLVIGGLFAWWWLDRRVRSRHGGFKIY